MTSIIIYCDGASRSNGKKNNVGGIGIFLKYGNYTKEIYKAYRGVTNNQMEIRAVIESLRAMKKFNIPIQVYTDSAYVCNCLNQKWYEKWMDNGWLTSNKKPVENRELWIELIELINKFPFISFYKVKGHSTDKYNNRVDFLANKAMDEFLEKDDEK